MCWSPGLCPQQTKRISRITAQGRDSTKGAVGYRRFLIEKQARRVQLGGLGKYSRKQKISWKKKGSSSRALSFPWNFATRRYSSYRSFGKTSISESEGRKSP